jgi:hypothetical protein
MGYYAFQQFNKGKYTKAIIYVILGGLFHASSIFYISLFILSKLFNIRKVHAFFILFVVIVISFYNSTIIEFIFNYILVDTMYGDYGSTVYRNIVTARGSGLTLISTQIIAISLFYFVPSRKDKIISSTLILFILWYFFTLMAQTLSVFGRISVLFMFGWFQMINIINVSPSKYKKIILLIVFIWSSALFTRQLTITYDETFKIPYTLVPYRTIFKK